MGMAILDSSENHDILLTNNGMQVCYQPHTHRYYNYWTQPLRNQLQNKLYRRRLNLNLLPVLQSSCEREILPGPGLFQAEGDLQTSFEQKEVLNCLPFWIPLRCATSDTSRQALQRSPRQN